MTTLVTPRVPVTDLPDDAVFYGSGPSEGWGWGVTVQGKPLDPRWNVRNHSPTGFSWGFGGSGAAQLALAILMAVTNQPTAERAHQRFQWEIIAKIPTGSSWRMTAGMVREWLRGKLLDFDPRDVVVKL